MYIKAPYHHSLAPKIRSAFKDTNIKLGFYNPKNNKQFYGKVKDKVPEHLRTNVVYKVNCKDCPKVYVGQTSQYLKTRLSQHQRNIDKKDQATGLSTHATQTGHQFDMNNVAILENEAFESKRKFLEACHILKYERENKSVNKQSDYKQISYLYHNVLS